MKRTTTVIIGAGQAGLAMSYHLNALSIDHVLLERGEIAHSWRAERWDSLRLLTPNWQSRLPGYSYKGADPDGYRDMPQTIDFLASYAQSIAAPVETNTEVYSVCQTETGYKVFTNRGEWECRTLVIASGACNIANVPAIAQEMPSNIRSITPMEYKNPAMLDEGGVLVVGASASGVQLAKEIQESGRQVTISTGEHVRLPRLYRGKDIQYWMDKIGIMDMDLSAVDDIKRARNVPSLQLIGTPSRESIDLNSLQASGIQVAGRMMNLNSDTVQFSGSLPHVCTLADLKMNRMLTGIDNWITNNGFAGQVQAEHRSEPTKVANEPLLKLDLKAANIKTIVWATGYRPDYSWLNVDVLDRKGDLRHSGGVVDAPGLFVLGLPFLRRRKSNLIDGVGDDARDLSDHIRSLLSGRAAIAA